MITKNIAGEQMLCRLMYVINLLVVTLPLIIAVCQKLFFMLGSSQIVYMIQFSRLEFIGCKFHDSAPVVNMTCPPSKMQELAPNEGKTGDKALLNRQKNTRLYRLYNRDVV